MLPSWRTWCVGWSWIGWPWIDLLTFPRRERSKDAHAAVEWPLIDLLTFSTR